MKNQVKKFSQYIKESDEFGMDTNFSDASGSDEMNLDELSKRLEEYCTRL